MTFMEEIKKRVQKDRKTIVLPESTDARILKATEIILKEKAAHIVLLGNKEEIEKKATQEKIDIKGAKLIEPTTSEKLEKYSQFLAEKEKTLSYAEAKKLAENPVCFGMLMVKLGDGDGYVSGAMNTTKNVLKIAMKLFDKKDTKILSTALFMVVPNQEYGAKDGVYVFSDCALNENPGYLALSEIAFSSAKTYEKFTGKQAKVAMLSYSSLGSACSKYTQKIVKATQRAKNKHPELIIDGELQLDSAIVPEVAKAKVPDSCIQGDANVLIFPDIQAGNIGCKLVERLAKGQIFGPICQGIEKPINDLSRGCTVEGIVGTILITAVQAQE